MPKGENFCCIHIHSKRLDCSKIEDGQKGVSDDATRDNRSSKEHRLRQKPKGSEHESSSEKRS